MIHTRGFGLALLPRRPNPEFTADGEVWSVVRPASDVWVGGCVCVGVCVYALR